MAENARSLAHVLVVGAFIGVLKPSPTTDVVDKSGLEIRSSRFRFPKEFNQSRPTEELHAALAVINKRLNDREVMLIRVLPDGVSLIFSRILLMLSRHPDIHRGSTCLKG
jgi:hypothetical protein